MAVAVALEEAVAAKDLRSRRGRQAGARQLPHHARGDRAVGVSCTAAAVHRGCLAPGGATDLQVTELTACWWNP